MCKTAAIIEEDGFVLRCVNQELFDKVKAAIDKTEPKELICIGIEKCCPVCKEGICLIGDDGCYGNYCSNCGQALDWGEDE